MHMQSRKLVGSIAWRLRKCVSLRIPGEYESLNVSVPNSKVTITTYATTLAGSSPLHFYHHHLSRGNAAEQVGVSLLCIRPVTQGDTSMWGWWTSDDGNQPSGPTFSPMYETRCRSPACTTAHSSTFWFFSATRVGRWWGYCGTYSSRLTTTS